MVEPIYGLKPAWCGRHLAGLRPETGLTVRYGATAFKAVAYHTRADSDDDREAGGGSAIVRNGTPHCADRSSRLPGTARPHHRSAQSLISLGFVNLRRCDGSGT